MKYEVVLAASAKRNLLKMPESVVAAVFEFMSGDLSTHPRRVGKELYGPLAGRWSARRGDYRLIYTIDDEVVEVAVVTVEHRRDAYHRR